jgi:recombination protein RecA
VVKNKVAAPFREAEFDIIYGEGISREGDLIDVGVEQGVLEKSGTWISFGADRLGQGRENARQLLKENADIRNKLEAVLRKKLGVPNGAASANGNSAAPSAATTAPAPADKPAMQAAAATAAASGGANAAAAKGRPTR